MIETAYKIGIVIPAFNEEATIADVVQRCLNVRGPMDTEVCVIVVDDGSVDRTVELAKAAGATVVSHQENLGVGRAFKTGLHEALARGAWIVVNIDADGQFDPARIPDLVQPILDGTADFTTASRFKDSALVPDMPRLKLWGNYLMSRLISLISGQRFHDVSCGFRAYNRDAALRLSLWGKFTYTQESILDLVIKGMRIVEVPMKVVGVRRHGESRVASNLWHYGTRTLRIILRMYRDYWPLHFFGWMSLCFLVPGVALAVFFIAHRLAKGTFTPHIWSGFAAAALVAFGALVVSIGLIGEMLARIRLNQELMLFYERERLYRREHLPSERARSGGSGAVSSS